MQGRVEDHWIQTELGGVSYLDTEPWRTEPLLAYLKRMVFRADVVPDAAEYGVLSLLGRELTDPRVLGSLGVDALPGETATPLSGGGFVRRMPTHPDGPPLALDVVAPSRPATGVVAAAPQSRPATGRRLDIRGASGRRAAAPTRRGHR